MVLKAKTEVDGSLRFFYVIGKSYNVKKRSARMRTRAKKKFVASDRARREISAITEIFFKGG